jgi:ATP-dependent DNA helicase RecQ
MRRQGAGPTVLISPLLALMRNQIAAAERLGIRALTVNSTNREDWDAVRRQLEDDSADLLLISPERLNNPQFRESMLPLFIERVGLLVVDEAHCVSDWGHDFRPDYRRIGDVLAGLSADVAVLFTTATANDRVVADVSEQLRDGAGDGHLTAYRGALARRSLHLAAEAAGLGHRLLPDQARHRHRRGMAQQPGHLGAGLFGRGRRRGPRRGRAKAARQRGQGRRRDLRPGHGLRQA